MNTASALTIPATDETQVQVGAVRIVDLAKAFNAAVAVDCISAEIPAGSYCCILGPSGCGKTTTLRMIAGHETVSGGQVYIDDRESTHLTPAQRATSLMFQSYALFPHLNVADNVGFGMRIQGVGKHERRARSAELLQIVEMEAFADRFPQQLSGGQQQRVALARALATKPAVLALDEPLSALDPFLRVRVRGELKALQRRLGITFLHVTHSQEEALALADCIMVMDKGRIEQFGTPEEVFHQPSSLFVARFMGAHNELPVRACASDDAHEGASNDAALKLKLFDGSSITLPDVSALPGETGALLTPIEVCRFEADSQSPIQPSASQARIPVRVVSLEYGGTGLVLRCRPSGHQVQASSELLVIHMPLSEIGPTPPEMGMEGTMTWPIISSFLRENWADQPPEPLM